MKNQYLILLYILLSRSAFSQPLFNKGFLWEVATNNVSAVQHPGGDYFLYGGKWLPEGGYLGKLDGAGNLLWADKLYYGNAAEGAVPSSCVIDSESNNLVFAVQAEYPNAGSMIMTDTAGNVLWNIDLDLPVTNVVRSIDSSYVFLGRRDQAGAASDFDIFLFKVSPGGSVIFAYHYVDVLPFHPYNFDDKMTYDLVQHPGGNIYALVAAAGNIFVMCFDTGGSVIWNTKYFSTGYNNPYVITPEKWKLLLMADNTLVVCGQQGNTSLPLKPMAFKLDLAGNVLWSKEYPSTLRTGLLNAYLNNDGTITLFGKAVINAAAGIGQNVFLNIDQNGDLINTFTVNDPQQAVYPLWSGKNADSTYLLLQSSGHDPSYSGFDTTQVIKLDAAFASSCSSDSMLTWSAVPGTVSILETFGLNRLTATYSTASNNLIITPRSISVFDFCNATQTENVSAEKNFTLFPNPSRDQIFIAFGQNIAEGFLYVFDERGSMVHEEHILNSSLLKFSTGNMSEGIYIVVVFDGTKHWYGKMSIEHSD